ncbi:putative 26S proteasome non-ATPase regulatory subunit 6 [Blattamonas nauphoetae]|uniref:26S proteasome non-ATPase regulatory subunit 6 n=1 Tax=Blattamonas nauphoetae TaxID=2049346 RepID=A0ABQ9Y9P0_9EUKA|nr:putative 26S proteasome non-ATPase regulatory subunit 6 [Blattamonas nauphoetae]
MTTPDYESSWIEASLLRQNNPLASITLFNHPELLSLIPEEKQKLWIYPEELLKYWIYHTLHKVDPTIQFTNYTIDWKDCVLYCKLFSALFPSFDASSVLSITDPMARAEKFIQTITPLLPFAPTLLGKHIILSDAYRNIIFLTNVFTHCSALTKSDAEIESLRSQLDHIKTMEERAEELERELEGLNEDQQEEKKKELHRNDSKLALTASGQLNPREAPAESLVRSMKDEAERQYTEKELDYISWIKQLGLKNMYQSAMLSPSDSTNVSFDRCLGWILIALRFNDIGLMKRKLDKIDSILSTGGTTIDWERKNRLTAFRATYAILTRNFADAAKSFSTSISTFVATELYPIESLVVYYVCSSIVGFSRSDLLEKVIRQSDVISVIDTIPHLRPLLHSFYNQSYAELLQNTFKVATTLLHGDKVFQAVAVSWTKDVRIRSYTQYLQPYKFVDFNRMTQQFGVSAEFLEQDLERFIVSGAMKAKINKVRGFVEGKAGYSSSTEFTSMLSDADGLISQMQTLIGSVLAL